MGKVGRPDKFTPERRKAIINDISNAIPYEYAAEANGISEETLYAWLRKAKSHYSEGIDTDYTQFSEAIKKAERNRIQSHQQKVSDKEDKWQADAWMLERRWWKHFSSSAPIVDFNKRLKRMEQGVSDDKVDSSEEKENT